jgi:hypothetical protein
MFSNKFNNKGVKNAKKRIDAAHNSIGKRVQSLGLGDDDLSTINAILEKNHTKQYMDLMNRAAEGKLTAEEIADFDEGEEEKTPASSPVSNPDLTKTSAPDLSFLGEEPAPVEKPKTAKQIAAEKKANAAKK